MTIRSGILSALLCAASVSPVIAQSVLTQPVSIGDVVVTGSLRTRAYGWDWFGGTPDGSYTYPEQSYYRWSYPYAYPYAGAGYGFGCGGYRHAGYGCGAYRSVGYGYGGYSGCGYGGCGAGYVQPTSYGPAYPAYRRPLYAPYRYRPALRVRAMHVRSKGY